MPSYTYECKLCGEFEAQQSIKDDSLTECPTCKEAGKDSGPPKRLISLTNFHLIGNGWAKDNYK
jgi:putative FmdB family regulatory protein